MSNDDKEKSRKNVVKAESYFDVSISAAVCLCAAAVLSYWPNSVRARAAIDRIENLSHEDRQALVVKEARRAFMAQVEDVPETSLAAAAQNGTRITLHFPDVENGKRWKDFEKAVDQKNALSLEWAREGLNSVSTAGVALLAAASLAGVLAVHFNRRRGRLEAAHRKRFGEHPFFYP